MKRFARIILCVMVLSLAIPNVAGAVYERIYEGVVTGGESVGVLAPFGGIVEPNGLRSGDRIAKGDSVAKLRTTNVYSPVEGTVSGIFGQEGDLTESITERYGAVMYVEPTNKYTIAATTEKAYNTSANKFIHIGESVYLSCTADGTHRGTGVVVKVENDQYTVEVTGGEFYMEENVGIFRKSNYSSSSRIGRGTVAATPAVAVKSSGSILRLNVQNGDKVERGELLFETVSGELDGLFAPGSEIVSTVSGIIASVDATSGAAVEKDGKLISVYPDDSIRLEIQIPESDLSGISVGMPMKIEFNWEVDKSELRDGTVDSISYLSTTADGGGEPTYTAYVSFVPDATVRMGMTALVYSASDHAEAEDGAPEDLTDNETIDEGNE